ncbi:MAG: hypothetical protein U9R25_02035 [Chloroflexota bacterium]|nr:hypothetical protein [Chloroflexota bacterium]
MFRFLLFILVLCTLDACSFAPTASPQPTPLVTEVDPEEYVLFSAMIDQKVVGYRLGEPVVIRELTSPRINDLEFALEGPHEIPNLGQRREASQLFPRGFTYYDFEFFSENEKSTVSWTAGTGDIAPVLFSFGGEEYFLVLRQNELARDNAFLDDDEMIIWPEAVYLKKQEGLFSY